ncbi:hypothetical protein Bwad002_07120 [Bilophila wadsworthia]
MPGGAFWESGKPPHRFPSRTLSLPKAFGWRGRAEGIRSGAGRGEGCREVPAPCRKTFKAVPNGPYHKE